MAVAPQSGPSQAGHRRRLSYALALAVSMLGLELAGGLLSNSLALLADAGHTLGDAAAVGLALGALWLAERPGSRRRTFGWARAEILAAMVNGSALLAIAGLVAWRAAVRIDADPEIAGGQLLAFAAVGLAANVAAALALRSGQRSNLNVRAAYYHVIGDALGSVGALVSGVVVLAWGWAPIDAIMSFVIAGLIAFNAVRLLREAADVLLEAAPPELDVSEVAGELCRLPGVLGVHDLHVWTVASGFAALSCHMEVAEEADADAILIAAATRLRDRFGLQHVTLQPETTRLHTAMACCEFPDLQSLGDHSVGHREPVARA